MAAVNGPLQLLVYVPWQRAPLCIDVPKCTEHDGTVESAIYNRENDSDSCCTNFFDFENITHQRKQFHAESTSWLFDNLRHRSIGTTALFPTISNNLHFFVDSKSVSTDLCPCQWTELATNVNSSSISSNTIGPLIVRVVMSLGVGGKGGFGANLRAEGRSGPSGHTRDFSMCRDLYGRRLKAVNDEIRLRKWLSEEEAAKRKELGADYREASGPAGVEGWFLGVPSWADGFKRSATGDLIAMGTKTGKAESHRPRRKTQLCHAWIAARAGGRRPPPDAPRWWGCSRGRTCDYAHGEEELRSSAKVEAAALRREAAAQDAARALEAYTKGLYLYNRNAEEDGDVENGGGNASGSNMLKSVLQGLRAQESSNAVSSSASSGGNVNSRKRRREEDTVSETANSKPNSPLIEIDPSRTSFEERGWLACIGCGPQDVEVERLSYATTSALGGASTTSETIDTDCAVLEVEGLGDFATVAVCGAGLWLDHQQDAPSSMYYEVEIVSGGVAQIGWALPAFSRRLFMAANAVDTTLTDAVAGDGVGDDEASWAFDGKRRLKWNEESSPYGRLWEAGDVVGCEASLLPRREQRAQGDTLLSTAPSATICLSFYLNGENLGTAFTIPFDDLMEANGSQVPTLLFPSVSVEAGELVRINLGKAGFAFPPTSKAQAVYSAARRIQDANAHSDAPVATNPSSEMQLQRLPPELWAGGVEVVTHPTKVTEDHVREAVAANEAPNGDVPSILPNDDNVGAVTTVTVSSRQDDHASETLKHVEKPDQSSVPVESTIASSSPLPSTAPTSIPLPPLDLASVTSVADILHAGYGLEDLKRELHKRGLKASGTLLERAARLFAVRDCVTPDAVPHKLRGADFPGPAWKTQIE